MYCSSCGAQAAQNLPYCNQCGTKFSRSKPEDKASEISPNLLLCAMVLIFFIGMASIIILTGASRTGNPIAIVALALSCLLVFSLEGLFIWLLFRRRKDGKGEIDANRLGGGETKELFSVPAHVLIEPAPSVTDHTTNQLQPVYVDREKERT